MPFKTHKSGVTVSIRLTPNARHTGFDGLMDIGDSKTALKVSINAIPEDGKANKELIAFLAKSGSSQNPPSLCSPDRPGGLKWF